MSISQADSGLFPDQYAILQAGDAPAAYSVEAHQYNTVFEEVDAPSAATSSASNFSILRAGRYIFRYSNGILERFDTQELAWTLMSSFSLGAISGFIENTPPTMTRSPEGTITVFQCTRTGLYKNTSLDNGDTWSGFVTCSIFGQPTSQTYYFYGPDQARDAIAITASSTLNGDTATYGPANVIDDDSVGSTAWVANAVATSTANQWIQFQFTDPVYVARAVLRVAEGRKGPSSVLIEYSSNGTTWTAGVSGGHNADGWVSNESRPVGFHPDLGNIGLGPAAAYWRIKFSQDEGSTEVTGFRDIQLQAVASETRGYITAISAPAWNRLHFVHWDSKKEYYNLRAAIWNEALSRWDLNMSPLYWPFRPTSFQATATSDDTDAIVIVSEMPGTLSIINEDNKAARYLLENGGVSVFTYKYGDWSDHIPVDVVEGIEDWRYRQNARITRINNRLYITAWSSDGTQDYPIEGYRCYRASNEGEHWSLNTLMGLPDGMTGSGLALAAEGEFVYAFESNKVYRASSTLFFGYSATTMRVDLTDYIIEYELSQSEVLQAGVRLSNAGGIFDNHPVLNQNNTVHLIHKAGFWTETEGVWNKVMVQIGRTQVETLRFEDELEERSVRLTSRDFLSRMTDYVKSEQARYWKSQSLGHDQYKDNTGTNYGGLSHTATVYGSHKTNGGYLEVSGGNGPEGEATSYSTFQSDIWNGAAQVGMLIPANTGASLSWSGIVFRTFWHAGYRVAAGGGAGRIYIDGPGNNYDESFDPVAWNGTPNTGRYIRVDFRYGSINVYSSTDSAPNVRDGGLSWTFQCGLVVTQEAFKLYMGLPTRMRREAHVMAHSGYIGTVVRGMDG